MTAGDPWSTMPLKFSSSSKAMRVIIEFVQYLPAAMRFCNDGERDQEIERLRRRAVRHRRSWPADHRGAIEAAINVLADLAKQGWRFRERDGTIEGEGPAAGGTDERRAQFHAQRANQLRTPSVRQFIEEMERKRFTDKGYINICSLMRDGRDLAAVIRAAKDRESGELDVVRPKLQFVRSGERCEHTRLLLMDIWRYFRHTWATPYQSIPGRTMMLLVRDAAAPNEPVMGIAALSSASVGMEARDAFIGWDDGFIAETRAKPSTRIARWMMRTVTELYDELYKTDLVEDGLLPAGCIGPNHYLAAERLRAEGSSSREVHHTLMASADYKHGKGLDGLDDSYWESQARSPLFRSKRAAELARLLAIHEVLKRYLGRRPTKESLVRLLGDSSGVRALRQLVRRAKARHVGVAITDLTICGAVAPYNELLAGKLVAMLAASPEVVGECRKRYRRSASIIASSMAGRLVRRGAELALVVTTSLYGSRPCQYDRISVPCELIGGKSGQTLAYKFLDRTQGFGTFQFSADTTRSVLSFLESSKNGRRVNYVFGEGANPRLRALRDGLGLLGLDAQLLLSHRLQKCIYVVPWSKTSEITF